MLHLITWIMHLICYDKVLYPFVIHIWCYIFQFDIKNHRVFLKKTKVSDCLRLEDLYIGSTVNILSRQLKFVDYGDDYTRTRFSHKKERFVEIKLVNKAVTYTIYNRNTVINSQIVINNHSFLCILYLNTTFHIQIFN